MNVSPVRTASTGEVFNLNVNGTCHTYHLLAALQLFPPKVVLFPTFCAYKFTLPCTLDHNSLKKALDWAETSEFLPLTLAHLIPS